MVMPMVPIQPNAQTTMIPLDAFLGQKIERNPNMVRKVVDRKKETAAAKEEVPREEIERAAEKLSRLLGLMGKNWEFTLEDEERGFVIRIIDGKTKEVGEISPQRLLEILESFDEVAGLFIDEQV